MVKRTFRCAAVVAVVGIVGSFAPPGAAQAVQVELDSSAMRAEAGESSEFAEAWKSLRELWSAIFSVVASNSSDGTEATNEGPPEEEDFEDGEGDPEPETDTGPSTDPDG